MSEECAHEYLASLKSHQESDVAQQDDFHLRCAVCYGKGVRFVDGNDGAVESSPCPRCNPEWAHQESVGDVEALKKKEGTLEDGPEWKADDQQMWDAGWNACLDYLKERGLLQKPTEER